VLDAERSLFTAQLQLVQTQGQLHAALINLYKALGGGWVDIAAERAPRPEVADGKQSERRRLPLSGRAIRGLDSGQPALQTVLDNAAVTTRYPRVKT